jgi:hypothetical protein
MRNSHFAFEAVLRESSAVAAFNSRSSDGAIANRRSGLQVTATGVAALSIFAGLGIVSAIIFVTGYSALLSDTPAIWIHRLMALTITQSILIAAVAMKILPIIERRRFTVRLVPSASRKMRLLEQNESSEEQPAPIPAPPRKAVIGGKLAGREFLEFDDGSIEIDTLVGRRRFVSLDAAREFVGA